MSGFGYLHVIGLRAVERFSPHCKKAEDVPEVVDWLDETARMLVYIVQKTGRLNPACSAQLLLFQRPRALLES
jgi:hypothetical protein